MRLEQEVLKQLRQWAAERANVRALILISSRANPRQEADVLSDYDVEVFVRDAGPFTEDDAWVSDFGQIMVRWPLTPRSTNSEDWITQLVLYEDGVRIDFQITALHPTASKNLDSGYRVLLDKDGLAAQLPEPTYSEYVIRRPTSAAFDSRINAFWWDIVYVAKALRRGELNYARHMLDGTIRYDKLQPLMEWTIGLYHGWSVNTGIYGRWFHDYLEPEMWERYRQTFAGSTIDSHWRALFSTTEFVRTLGQTLAQSLGFEYPDETDRQVTAHMRWIRDLDHLGQDRSHEW